MLKRLILVLLLMAFTRMLLLVFNPALFPGVNIGDATTLFFQGLRFDLSAVIYLNVLYILMQSLPLRIRGNRIWQKISDISFIVFNTIGFMPNLIDSVYYRFTMKRLTGDIFSYVSLGDDTWRLMPRFAVDFWYIPLLWIIMILLVIIITRHIKPRLGNEKQGVAWYGVQLFLMLFTAAMSVLGMRGGVQLKPVGILTAAEMAGPQNAPLVLNSAFSVMRTLDQEGLENKNYFTREDEMLSYFNSQHNYAGCDSAGNALPMHKRNVVVVIMESFSCEHISSFNPSGAGDGFTPFLDSLIHYSQAYKAYANGKRSIEGIPAILASIPTWMPQDFITSVYSGNKINSLASLLGEKGYFTSFFHGGKNGTMGFDAFCRSAGFKAYYGKNEYPDAGDFDGDWGIWDEPFLQYFSSELSRMPQPFMSAVFTLSSHHPYKIPEKYNGKFLKGQLPIQESIMYADYALKQFFKTASQQPWFRNTLFIITADHTSEAVHDYYENRLGQYAIPIIIYDPANPRHDFSREIAQQTDIMPTILDLLGYDKPFIAFGNSLKSNRENRFSLSYLSGSYQLVTEDGLLQWQNDQPVAFYALPSDSLLKNNILDKEINRLKSHENLLRSVIQQYNSRMIGNRLTTQ